MYKKNQTIANLLLVSACESLFFILWLMFIPREGEGSFLFGFSIKRLVIIAIIMLGAIAFLSLYFFLKRKKNLQSLLFDERHPLPWVRLLLSLSLMTSLGAWCGIFIFHFLQIPWMSDELYIRLLPFLIWVFVISIQFLIIFPGTFFKKVRKIDYRNVMFSRSFLIIFAISVLLLLIVVFTRLGIDTVIIGVIDLGVPLLEGQLWFCIGIVFIFLWWTYSVNPHLKVPFINSKISRIVKSDWFIFICIWVLTILVWMSQPLPSRNYFAPKVVPPNNEIYPFSDAASYDLDAYKVIDGNSTGRTIPKALYVTFLAFLHLIGGNKYGTIILLQTIVLGLLPAILYLIGRELDDRPLGILLALFSIFRELNSIQVVDVANVSNSKLLLSDMPTMLGMSILVLIVIKWLKEKDWQIIRVIMIGGMIGLLILIRFQILLLAPLLILFAVYKYYKKWKRLFLFCLCMLVVIGIVILPALIRNYLIDGTFWLEKSSYFIYFAHQITSNYDFGLYSEMGETGAQMQRFLPYLINIIKTNGIGVFSFIPDHFFRNIISSFLIFPIRADQVSTFVEFLSADKPFWSLVPSGLSIFEFFIVAINLILISFGISFLYRKNRLVCLWLISLFVIYDLSTAVGRLSGWRFILPVDWIFLLFYGIGILEIIRWIISKTYLRQINEENKSTVLPRNKMATNRYSILISIVLFVMIMFTAAFIPLRENLFSPRFSVASKAQLCDEIIKTPELTSAGINPNQLVAQCELAQTIVMKGKALYPRFIEKGFGFKNRGGDIYFGPQNFSRLVFYINGNTTGNMFMPMNQPPDFFPNGAEVLVMGKQDDYFQADLILVRSKDTVKIIPSGLGVNK